MGAKVEEHANARQDHSPRQDQRQTATGGEGGDDIVGHEDVEVPIGAIGVAPHPQQRGEGDLAVDRAGKDDLEHHEQGSPQHVDGDEVGNLPPQLVPPRGAVGRDVGRGEREAANHEKQRHMERVEETVDAELKRRRTGEKSGRHEPVDHMPPNDAQDGEALKAVEPRYPPAGGGCC